MSRTDAPAALIARSARGLLLGLLCGCMSSRGLPLLYADPGVLIERPGAGVITYRRGMALRTGDIVQTTGGDAVIEFDPGNRGDPPPHTPRALGPVPPFFRPA